MIRTRAIVHSEPRLFAMMVLLSATVLAWTSAALGQTVTAPARPAGQPPALAGTATWPGVPALPDRAVFEATVLDVSRIDRAPELIGRTRIRPIQDPAIRFAIPYDPALIKPGHRYTIDARITEDGRVRFATAGPVQVLAGGVPAPVALTLTPADDVSATTLPPPASPASPAPTVVAPTPSAPAPLTTGPATTGMATTGPVQPIRRIRGLYRGLPTGPAFVECGDSRAIPVATAGEDTLLASAYRRAQPQSGAALLAEVEGRIGFGPLPDGRGLGRVLSVERFIDIRPGETCAPATDAAATRDALPLRGTTWTLLSLGDQTIVPAPSRTVPTLVLNRDIPVFGGSGGCDGIGGEYAAADQSLTLTLGPSTRMACPAAMELESAYREALAKTTAWSVTGRHLTLYDRDGNAVLRFTAGG